MLVGSGMNLSEPVDGVSGCHVGDCELSMRPRSTMAMTLGRDKYWPTHVRLAGSWVDELVIQSMSIGYCGNTWYHHGYAG